MKPTSFVHIALISIAVLAVANIDLTPRVAAHPSDTATILLLEARLNALEEKLQFVTIETGPINGLAGPHMIITGANIHIRDGSGTTAGPNSGLGNLVVGYNESPPVIPKGARVGSHNLIIGPEHRFTSFGGLVAGRSNTISGAYASVSGGRDNEASDWYASVSGGRDNTASYWYASISGGGDNTASDLYASVSGGRDNTASDWYASVSGGSGNTASGNYASISGGGDNTASGGYASISGGYSNTASGGYYASVSGGSRRTAGGHSDWVAGSLWENY